MSARKTEQETTIRHPRETPDLFGHREAETALLTAYRSGRIPHALLIGGAQECLDTIEKYSKAGVTHFMFASVAPFELDEIRSFAEEVIPQTR